MKPVKYPLFGKWLEKVRGSHSHQWIGNKIGKEHNTVTEYANGYSRPPKLIVAFLINLFEANPLEIADFLFYDPNELNALCDYLKVSGYSTNEFRDDSWNRLCATCELRKSGKLLVAKRVIDKLILQLDARIKAEIEPGKNIKDLKFILLKSYAERVILTTLLVPRGEIVEQTISDRSQMVNLSIELDGKIGTGRTYITQLGSFKANDTYIPGFSCIAFCDSCIAASYFVAKDYEKSVSYQIRAIPLCGFDKHLLAETYRGLVLGLAHLKRKNEFLKYEKEINILIGKEINDKEDNNSLRLALAEGRILLGLDGPKIIIAEVEKSILYPYILIPLKTIQFYKTKLFYLMSDIEQKRYVDIDLVKQISRDGSSLAKSYGYNRHAKEIEQLSNLILNGGKHQKRMPIQLSFSL